MLRLQNIRVSFFLKIAKVWRKSHPREAREPFLARKACEAYF